MAPDRGKPARATSSRAWNTLQPPLSPWIIDAMAAMNFARMTPVQASTIPLFMTHKDVVVEAVTGSGKTFAFLIPIVQKLLQLEEPLKEHHVAAIIVSPTRELATQIYNVLLSLLAFHEPSAAALGLHQADKAQEELSTDREELLHKHTSALKILPQLLLGGVRSAAQDLSIFLNLSSNVLISTPGRLLEILSSPYVHCPQSSFEVLVLDEADRLLDLGFKDDLTKILNLLPKQRRTGLFSASVSEAVDQIIRVGLRNPVRIAVKVKSANGVEDKRTPASLRMTYLVTPASQKLLAVQQVLKLISPTPLRTIVFLSTCAAVDYYQHLLSSVLPDGMVLVPLHGKHPANVRQKNFVKFTNSASPAVLLTTDVASRGLDIPQVDLVIQIDPPSDPKVFIHRCGRAGRAGRKGLSVVLLQPGREEEFVSFLQVRSTPIEPLTSPEIALAEKDAVHLNQALRSIILKDRALHDTAQKAFVSWVRSYSNHQASSIFRIADLDWADLAEGWALLRMPKMPELKGWDRSQFRQADINWEDYAYMDKLREKHRKELTQEDINERRALLNAKKRNSTTPWSQKVEHKESREVKRSKREARREFEKHGNMTEAEREHEIETHQMLEQVKRQQREAAAQDEVFEGFG